MQLKITIVINLSVLPLFKALFLVLFTIIVDNHHNKINTKVLTKTFMKILFHKFDINSKTLFQSIFSSYISGEKILIILEIIISYHFNLNSFGFILIDSFKISSKSSLISAIDSV